MCVTYKWCFVYIHNDLFLVLYNPMGLIKVIVFSIYFMVNGIWFIIILNVFIEMRNILNQSIYQLLKVLVSSNLIFELATVFCNQN